jgi:hypothetical protein
MKKIIYTLCILNFAICTLHSLPAFPGAEGYGSETPGGRGGQVIIVTNLNADGTGSFKQAMTTPGPRIIVFRVSGVIKFSGQVYLNAENLSNVTIAGQTSPGGITVTSTSGTPFWQYSSSKFHDAIWRFLRFRVGSTNDHSFEQYLSYNWIIDHCDFSGGTDECFDLANIHDITLQWSTVTNSGPTGQKYGMLIAGGGVYNITMHHNFIANHIKRGPVMHWYGNSPPHNGMIDYRNNVGYNFATHVMRINPPDTGVVTYVNTVGNYFKEGPARDSYLYGPVRFEDQVHYYLDRNHFDTDRTRWDGSMPPDTIVDRRFGRNPTRVFTEHTMPPVTTVDAFAAKDMVLTKAGAWPRDSMNYRTIREFNARTGQLGVCNDPRLESGPALPDDSDMDGMPDCWETHMGLNPSDGTDHSGDHDSDGYTNIEEYINDVALSWIGDMPHNGMLEDGCPTNVEEAGLLTAKAPVVTISPNPISSGPVLIKSTGFKQNNLTISIVDIKGRLIMKFPASPSLKWNCRDGAGMRVAPGVYVVKLTENRALLSQKKLIVIK